MNFAEFMHIRKTQKQAAREDELFKETGAPDNNLCNCGLLSRAPWHQPHCALLLSGWKPMPEVEVASALCTDCLAPESWHVSGRAQCPEFVRKPMPLVPKARSFCPCGAELFGAYF